MSVELMQNHVEAVEAREREFYVFQKGWAAMVTNGALSRVLDFGRNASKVFIFCVEHAKPGNRVEHTQAAIAEKLGLPASRISEAMRVLRDEGYLLVRREAGRNYYYVNPNIAYRGSAGSHRAVITKLAPPALRVPKVEDISA